MTPEDAKLIFVSIYAIIMLIYILVNVILNSIAFIRAIPDFVSAGTLGKELWYFILCPAALNYRRRVSEWLYERKVETYYKPRIERLIADKHPNLTEHSKRALREMMLCYPEYDGPMCLKSFDSLVMKDFEDNKFTAAQRGLDKLIDLAASLLANPVPALVDNTTNVKSEVANGQ